jgi:hypothetical protein
METNFRIPKYQNILEAVVAFAHVFCYFTSLWETSRLTFTIYYALVFIENTILILCWYLVCDKNIWYRFPAIIAHYIFFFIGLLLLVSNKLEIIQRI